MAPCIVCLALLGIGQDVVGRNQQAISLEAHMEGQAGDCRGRMAAVGVVELYEGIEAVLAVGVAAAAPEDLVGSRRRVRRDGLGPAQHVCVAAMGLGGGVLGITARVSQQCMTRTRRAGRGGEGIAARAAISTRRQQQRLLGQHCRAMAAVEGRACSSEGCRDVGCWCRGVGVYGW